MAELVIDDLQQGYIDIIKFVLDQGEEVSPRGMRTKEVRNATIVLTDPVKAIPMGIGRKLNMKIGAVETTQLIAGISSAMQLNLVSNNNFENYMNNGRLLGAYGPRLHPQLEHVIRMIARDPDTRQAAALVWRGDETQLALMGNNDVPCTVALSWNVRNGKLNASTVMRSNDVYLGIAYDFWMFTRLQMTLAWALGLEVGDYRHHAISLHAYERDWDKVDSLEVTDSSPKYPGGYTGPEANPENTMSEDASIMRWRMARGWAEAVVFGQEVPECVSWYRDLLKDHAAIGKLCENCRYVYNPGTEDYAQLEQRSMCTRCAFPE